jgi:acyl-CoA reductase-like NAD-dependent aldehyde dehydrogenase
MSVTTVNPATGAALATYEETSAGELDAVLDRADAAAAVWRDTPVGERADGLRRLAATMRERIDDLALLATREMGKPLEDSRAEVEKCA